MHHAAPGDRLTVRANVAVACLDTNHPQDQVVPARHNAVRVLLIQGTTQLTLATADTDGQGYLSTEVTIPASANAGAASIRVDHVEGDAFLTIG